MIDIHCHLLPGIDDGPETLQEALLLANYAVNNGIKKAVVTPHIHPGRYENDLNSINVKFLHFKKALLEQNIELELGMAAEVRVCPEILPMLLQDRIPFLGICDDYKIMLIEFPHNYIPPGSEKLVKHLLNRGIKPLIAHPERNKDVMDNINVITPFVEMGCMLQLTAASVAGKFGERCYASARELLIRNWVTVIASDAHNEFYRPPDLKQGYKAAELIMGSEIADELVFGMPLKLVSSQFS